MMSGARSNFVFAEPKAVVGMIHVAALPGTPRHELPVDQIVGLAVEEARLLTQGGVDGLIIENMHDRPYLCGHVGPEIVAGMTAVAVAVRREVSVPLGIQVLAGANKPALAIAQAGGAQFVRAEGFVFAHVADEGLMATADAGSLLRYRKQIGAEGIAILADIKKKHSSHSITADVDLAETARAAEFFGADGVVVTGVATGEPTNKSDVQTAADAVEIPIAVGSGLRPDNLRDCWPQADIFIVGSFVKREGLWSNPIDPERLAEFMAAVKRLRKA